MQQMRRFMADAAHELRTPITILRTRAEVASGEAREPARDRATLEAIEREAARLGASPGGLPPPAPADAGGMPGPRGPPCPHDAAAAPAAPARAPARCHGAA